MTLANVFEDDLTNIIVYCRQIDMGVAIVQQADFHTFAHIHKAEYLWPEQTFAPRLKTHIQRGFQRTLQGFQRNTATPPGPRERHKSETAFIYDETHG